MFETYIIKGERGLLTVRQPLRCSRTDIIIIMSYAFVGFERAENASKCSVIFPSNEQKAVK